MRDPQTKSNLVDLSLFYNVRLDQDFNDEATKSPGRREVYNLSALPRGVTWLGKAEFDLRGAVLLTSSVLKEYRLDFPKQVKGIPVAHTCRRLHFLHAAGWPEATGTSIGYYRLHYADGKQEEIPLVYGQSVDNCVVNKSSRPATAEWAWTGTNSSGTVLRLFQTTWENPRRNTVIESMDFVSQVTKSAPLLIAITVE